MWVASVCLCVPPARRLGGEARLQRSGRRALVSSSSHDWQSMGNARLSPGGILTNYTPHRMGRESEGSMVPSFCQVDHGRSDPHKLVFPGLSKLGASPPARPGSPRLPVGLPTLCVRVTIDDYSVKASQEDMPTYVYGCDTCSHRFEIFQKFQDASLTECPQCGARIRRIFQPAGIVFKGSGWYSKDSRLVQ
jgi:putative FmdB family regulatory protein